jgi:hypothetical protein
MMFSHSDIKMPIHEHAVTVWHVREVSFGYPTKIAAEGAARKLFPNETHEQRYARISFSIYRKD